MHVRIKLLNEPGVPSEILYDVTNSGNVLRTVEVESDGSIFWDDVSAYHEKGEMIGKISLIEGRFPPTAEWPEEDSYENISDDEFQKMFERAVSSGKRRRHADI